ncbi:LysR family transcriptional regulator [Colwellia psychrerythraea]|uniref:Transcriptional regulator, LysR family n=1 Tax=Colwellia psychrerythraea TaxID=28229 RepID=A0A099K9C1_COLPS|nr:LysR family transcriptional regulator [Colwellia psychrerythraea]KGJ86890.1 transcriptional regulator, LysR family [Colwellia psychrerythraea]
MFNKSEQKRLAYQMLVFDEVLKQGSFTEAAYSLGHTKSAISQYVSQLEQALGVRLLNRSTRTLNLTPTGQLIAKRSEQLLELLTVTLDEIHENAIAPAGRIAITAPHAFEASLVTPIITALCNEYPKLTPELIFTDERLDILKHQLDVAISVGPQKDSSYHAILIGELESVLVASPQYLAKQSEINEQNLSLQTLIMLPWQSNFVLTKGGEDVISFDSLKYLKMNTSTSAINSAVTGAGICLIPSVFIKNELQSGTLQRILPDYLGEARNVYAVHSYQQQLPLILRLFINKLKAKFLQAQ